MRPYRAAFILFVADLAGFLVCYNLVHGARTGKWISLHSSSVWLIVATTILTLYVMDVYRTEEPETRSRLPLQTFFAVMVAGIASTVVVYFLGVEEFNSFFGRGVLPVTFALFSLWASFWRWLLTHRQQKSASERKWIFIGEEEKFEAFSREFGSFDESKILSRIDPYAHVGASNSAIHSLVRDATRTSFLRSGIVVAADKPLPDELATEVMRLRFSGIPVLTLSEFFEKYWSKVPVLHLRNGWFIQTRGFELVHDRVGLRLKRLLDIVVAVLGLILSAPVMFFIGLFVKLDSHGSVFYIQERTGLRGAIFALYKFRTMINDAEKNGICWTEKNDPRITRVGKFLRITRLDELPQLWNILKGEMSIIGPRPERPELVSKLEEKIPFYDLRHLVPPGITGWAQVMYQYGASIEDSRKKLEYDLFYIKNHSIQLDFSIIIKTFIVMLKRSGR